MNYLLVFIGGGLGSIVRFAIGNFSKNYLPSAFPFGTFISNAASSFILGMVLSYFLTKTDNESAKLFMAIGFCGGFSTFSAFTFETVELFKTGNTWMAILNAVLNLTICIVLFVAGYSVFRGES